jgi:hypothetical protein
MTEAPARQRATPTSFATPEELLTFTDSILPYHAMIIEHYAT